MKHLTPDHELVLPAAATADVTHTPNGPAIDLTNPDSGHVTRLTIPASHPGDARVTVDALIRALVDLDVRLHDAELAYEWQQEVA